MSDGRQALVLSDPVARHIHVIRGQKVMLDSDLAALLNSSVAVRACIQVVRAFVRLRAVVDADSELSRKLTVLERTYDQRFRMVFNAIRQLMHSPPIRRRRIGVHAHHRRER